MQGQRGLTGEATSKNKLEKKLAMREARAKQRQEQNPKAKGGQRYWKNCDWRVRTRENSIRWCERGRQASTM